MLFGRTKLFSRGRGGVALKHTLWSFQPLKSNLRLSLFHVWGKDVANPFHVCIFLTEYYSRIGLCRRADQVNARECDVTGGKTNASARASVAEDVLRRTRWRTLRQTKSNGERMAHSLTVSLPAFRCNYRGPGVP